MARKKLKLTHGHRFFIAKHGNGVKRDDVQKLYDGFCATYEKIINVLALPDKLAPGEKLFQLLTLSQF